MTEYPLRRTRPGLWHSSATPISTTVSSISTDDPLLRVMTLPMPTLNLVFGGDRHGDVTLTRAFEPAPTSSIPTGPDPLFEPSLAYCPIDRDKPVLEHPQRIELSIDSLPNHMLVEPIPVAIDPDGDNGYTAWVHNLEANATGSSVIEALLTLKERIEFIYDDLNKRTQLTNQEKTTLQILHTYIAPKRPE